MELWSSGGGTVVVAKVVELSNSNGGTVVATVVLMVEQ